MNDLLGKLTIFEIVNFANMYLKFDILIKTRDIETFVNHKNSNFLREKQVVKENENLE